jgi:hypothetical protein
VAVAEIVRIARIARRQPVDGRDMKEATARSSLVPMRTVGTSGKRGSRFVKSVGKASKLTLRRERVRAKT